MTRRAALIVSALTQIRPNAARDSIPIVIDTDAGSDDLLAIAFLLSRQHVQIEAISVVDGLAHVATGATNVLRLLALAGRPDVRVYLGEARQGNSERAFPSEWRRASDELPGIRLPSRHRRPEIQRAVEFLSRRLEARSHPVRVLALGPLTNLAGAVQNSPLLAGLEHLVIMGGALNVPGNLNDGGLLKTYNKTAEWNIFVDPAAASIVFTSVARMTLIPLDATVKVPIDSAFLKEFRMHARTPLGKFAGEVLDSNRNAIESGYFQAWDPLAAVALVQPAVVATKPMKITVLQARPAEGRTVGAESSNANVAVALDANASEFKRTFFSAF